MAGITWPGYPVPRGYVVDVGVIMVNAGVSAFGASVGGLTWDPKKTVRVPEYDGRSSEVEGQHRTIKYEASLSGKIKRGFANIGDFEPGSSSDGSSGDSSGNTITLLDIRTPWSEGMYLENVEYWGRQQDGTIGVVNMPRAYVKSYKLATKDNDEGEWDIDIVPVLAASVAATNPNAVPFTYHVVEENA